MKKLSFTILSIPVLVLFSAVTVMAHCEIPCGIYDDAARLSLIQEHIMTIEKSMKNIDELKGGENPNQLVRWVLNKEEHANKLQSIVAQYFMTQRIKPGVENYDKKLAALHKMLVYSMKCKQTVDYGNVEKLKEAAKEFHDLYQHQ